MSRPCHETIFDNANSIVISFPALRSPAVPLTSFHDLLVFLISSSIVLRHVLFGLLLLLQEESLARGPKLLSIKNYVIEIMTWKFIYAYWKRCKTGPAHNRCWNWSPFTSKHTWMRFSKFWNTFPKVSKLTAWISWRKASLIRSIVRGCIFVHFALQ